MKEQGIIPVPLDLPGHGTHDEGLGQGFTLDDAIAVVDEATATIGQYDLIGYSMGGRIALHVALARSHRVRRLVLESASPGLSSYRERAERREADEQLASMIEREGIVHFVNWWETIPVLASQRELPVEVSDRVRRLRIENDAAALACSLRGLGTGALPSLWDRLESVACPTLLMVGATDTKFVRVAEEMATSIPDASLAKFQGVGHAVHLEAPNMWLRSVVPFLISGRTPLSVKG